MNFYYYKCPRIFITCQIWEMLHPFQTIFLTLLLDIQGVRKLCETYFNSLFRYADIQLFELFFYIFWMYLSRQACPVFLCPNKCIISKLRLGVFPQEIATRAPSGYLLNNNLDSFTTWLSHTKIEHREIGKQNSKKKKEK